MERYSHAGDKTAVRAFASPASLGCSAVDFREPVIGMCRRLAQRRSKRAVSIGAASVTCLLPGFCHRRVPSASIALSAQHLQSQASCRMPLVAECRQTAQRRSKRAASIGAARGGCPARAPAVLLAATTAAATSACRASQSEYVLAAASAMHLQHLTLRPSG